MKINLFIFRSFRVKMALAFIAAMLFVGVTSNFLIYRYALDAQFEQLRTTLKTVASASALMIDAKNIMAIPLNGDGARSPQYSVTTARLARIKNAIPSITYIYILSKTDKNGMLQFVVDLDTPDASREAAATPGDLYDASRFPEMLKAFNGPTADKALCADRWGVFLSGYAPIRDSGGRTVAILGVDMKAQDVYDAQKEVRMRAIFVFGLGLALSIFFAILISGTVTRKIKALVDGTKIVAQGNLDHKVIVSGEDEIAMLASYFNTMSSDLKRHIEELKRTTAQNERLLKELEIAHGIQQSFLPDSVPKPEGIDIAAVSLPARVVGGDFYDFIPVDKDRWGLVVADVSGKGVPAALFMALSRTLMRASATALASPAQAIIHANDLILHDSKTSMFVTLFYAILDAKTRIIRYANAGHNPPMVVNAAVSDIVLLKAQGVPLGIVSNVETTTEEITLKSGDVVVLYTDGVTEAVNKEGVQFEMDRLAAVVRDSRALSAGEIIEKIRSELALFVGDVPQFDDITIMVLKAA